MEGIYGDHRGSGHLPCGELCIMRLTPLIVLPLLTGCQAMKAFSSSFGVNPKTGEVSGTLEGASGNFYKGLNITAGSNSGLALIVLLVVVVALPFVYPVSRKARLWAENRRDTNAERVYQRGRAKRLSSEPYSSPQSTMAAVTLSTGSTVTPGTSLVTPHSKPSASSELSVMPLTPTELSTPVPS